MTSETSSGGVSRSIVPPLTDELRAAGDLALAAVLTRGLPKPSGTPPMATLLLSVMGAFAPPPWGNSTE